MSCEKCSEDNLCQKCKDKAFWERIKKTEDSPKEKKEKVRRLMRKWLRQNKRAEQTIWQKKHCKGAKRTATSVSRFKTFSLSGGNISVNYE